jgi:tetratricopeptide (TPR) repeat protein/SAM-dependent methyltransferase
MTPPGDPSNPQRVTIAQALEIAIQNHNAGQLGEARSIYEQILAAEPTNHDALHLLGLIANEQGENERAVALIQQAIALAPGVGEMHGNLGLVFQDLERPAEAVACFEKALDLNPNFAEGHNNLGLAQQDLGRLEDALESFERALAVNSQFAEAHSNLGNALKETGRLDDAAASHRRALEIAPDFAEAHNNLGNVLHAMGQLDDAIESFRTALRLNPEYAEAQTNLGGVLQEQGHLDDAIACYRKALANNPDLAEAHSNLGIALMETEAREEALACHRKAVALMPGNDAFWMGFAACVEVLTFTSSDTGLFEDLLRLLDHPAVDPQAIAPSILDALRTHPDMAAVLGKPTQTNIRDAAQKLSAIPLLLRVLTLSPLKDLEVEAMLTAQRRGLLELALENDTGERGIAFLTALARHSFINEYIFRETAEETENIDRIQGKVDKLLASEQRPSSIQLAALAAYRPLHRLERSDDLLQATSPKAVQDLLTQQIAEPRAEHTARAEFPALTLVEGAVSQSVRAQYEENPYPRWIKFAAQHKPATIGEVLRGAPLRFELRDYESPSQPKILIAGCGTGQQALLAANRYRNADILAVDLSLSSLSYAQRKTREYGVGNIRYANGDIMAFDGMEQQFDLIECVGVLHHLADPLAGWGILADRLEPSGVMKIGLYSETARQDVVAARALIAERGYDATPHGIRRCREAIMALAQDGDPDMTRLIGRNSFFTASESRDLIFHAQEHRFTLPQIETTLEILGLDFLGFEMRSQHSLRHFKESHPNALTSLAKWHAFELENPETFSGMYQFWVRKR